MAFANCRTCKFEVANKTICIQKGSKVFQKREHDTLTRHVKDTHTHVIFFCVNDVRSAPSENRRSSTGHPLVDIFVCLKDMTKSVKTETGVSCKALRVFWRYPLSSSHCHPENAENAEHATAWNKWNKGQTQELACEASRSIVKTFLTSPRRKYMEALINTLRLADC